uniref:Uncharacterized protein n=1 Tax=Utricularia reniformis TaxID=192314 RepID=A0A1Y0B0V7_9LAMI|nr:hypothetical protein AEK19_MT0771 [Utricularia reniformis]ART31014.1 hypothetical protein AEK19_MT0771 [Utricularia reniformis]
MASDEKRVGKRATMRKARTDSNYYWLHMKEWALLSLNGEKLFYSFTCCYLTKEWSSLCYPFGKTKRMTLGIIQPTINSHELPGL